VTDERTYQGRRLRVPHVASWTDESTDVVRHCPMVGAPAAYTRGRQGRGEPRWGELHPERQRRAMYLLRCQVCDTQLIHEDANLVVWDGLQHDEDGHVVVLEPWLCDRCCQYALAVCPGLARQKGTRVLRGTKVLMLATTCRMPDGREAVSYVKALLPELVSA
jgi:hypothetical protein